MEAPLGTASAKEDEMGSVEQDISALSDLDSRDLKSEWHRHYRAMPPRWFSRDLTIRGIAYKIQARAQRGLSRTTQKKLQSAGHTGCNGALALKPGIKLVREWRGVTHMVHVLEADFEYRGERYGSLSKIAREITGARWSGPRFFGLTKTPNPSSPVPVPNNE